MLLNTGLHSAPTSGEILSAEEIYKAVKNWELVLFQPAIEADRIAAGYQNDLSLPAGSNDYVINTIISHIEHGTPVVRYEDTGGALVAVVHKLEELVLQVDCYSKSVEDARLRCESLSAVARTPLAIDFMRLYGVSSLYATPPRNTTVVIDAEKYVHRWTTELHLSYTHRVALNVESFTSVNTDVVNVDVRFPPNK